MYPTPYRIKRIEDLWLSARRVDEDEEQALNSGGYVVADGSHPLDTPILCPRVASTVSPVTWRITPVAIMAAGSISLSAIGPPGSEPGGPGHPSIVSEVRVTNETHWGTTKSPRVDVCGSERREDVLIVTTAVVCQLQPPALTHRPL